MNPIEVIKNGLKKGYQIEVIMHSHRKIYEIVLFSPSHKERLSIPRDAISSEALRKAIWKK